MLGSRSPTASVLNRQRAEKAIDSLAGHADSIGDTQEDASINLLRYYDMGSAALLQHGSS